MVTRRVANGEARLRPSRKTNGIIGYVIAILVNHYKLEVNALCAIPNHYHMRANDPDGRMSDFKRDCHSILAKLIMHAYDEPDEQLWSSRQSNEVETVLPEDALSQMAYILTNPIKHGMVKYWRNYPGIRRIWGMKPKTFKRPPGFFRMIDWTPDMLTDSGRPKINWAETATLTMARPRGFEDHTDFQLAERLGHVIRETARQARIDREAAGGGFLTKRGVKEMARRDSAGPKPRGQRVPTIRCSDPKRRAEWLAERRRWLAAYNDARLAYRTDRQVVFPYGTDKMRWLHGVNVAPAPT